jgi:hypothetical protein
MNTILEMKFGSHLYGTNTPNSDLDFKAIYIPNARDIVLGTVKQTIAKSRPKSTFERNTKDDIDIEILSLDRYLDLLMEGQTMALDILFGFDLSDCTDEGRNIMCEIFTNRDKLLTRNVNAFVGYARQQAAKYGIKGSRMDSLKRVKELLDRIYEKDTTSKLASYRSLLDELVEGTKELVSLEKLPLIEIVMLCGPKGAFDAPHLRVNGRAIPLHAQVKYAREVVGKMLDSYGQRAHKAHLAGGVDWKALSHAVRVNAEALELLNTGKITFPCQNKDLLVQIKTGQLTYDAVAEMIEQGLADLYKAQETSILRETPDREWAANLIYDIYRGVVKSS